MSTAETQEDVQIDDVVDIVDQQDDDIDEKPQKKVEPEAKGHMSLDAWIAAGKDPSEWRSPEDFRVRGIEIKLRKEFDERLRQNNFIHQQRLERELSKARAERKEAISIADHNAVDALDMEIEAIRDQQTMLKANMQQQATVKDDAEVLWEAKNPWIFDNRDPRTAVALAEYSKYQQLGMTAAQATAALDNFLANKFSAPDKIKSPMVESSRTATGERQQSGMKWSDLSREDIDIFNQVWPKTKDLNADKRAFLKAMRDEKKV